VESTFESLFGGVPVPIVKKLGESKSGVGFGA